MKAHGRDGRVHGWSGCCTANQLIVELHVKARTNNCVECGFPFPCKTRLLAESDAINSKEMTA